MAGPLNVPLASASPAPTSKTSAAATPMRREKLKRRAWVLSLRLRLRPAGRAPCLRVPLLFVAVRFDDPGIEAAYVTFSLGAEGKVERITMKPVSPLADFSFDYQDLLFTPAP